MTQIHPLQQIDFIQPVNACVIEASAGTGKTWTIERLYIKALLEGSAPQNANMLLTVENILVVTFTNDATDELKERLYTQIETSISLILYLNNHKQFTIPDDDIFTAYLLGRQNLYKKDVIILSRALQNFDQAAIFTIHGFCNKILRDYPFECQVNPEFELISDKSDIFKQIVLNFLRSQILTASCFAKSLDIVMRNLDGFFTGSYTTPLIDRIVNKLPKDLFKVDQAGYAVKYQVNIPQNINFLADEQIEDKPYAKAQFLGYLIDYIYTYYQTQPQQKLSYDELIQKTADSLNTNKELADKIFYKFPVAFIDEFQDTDLLQWQIFSRVYGLDTNLQTGQVPRGNVVVVGDPKQAIYRFRGADIDTYLDARQQIKQHMNLLNNYRSHPNIMNFINQIFDLINQNCTLNDSYLGDSINYMRITASAKSVAAILPDKQEVGQVFVRNNISADWFDEEVHIVAIRGATKAVRNNNLLKAMTFEILALLNTRPGLKGKIAVLVTKNREAVELVKYFANFGIKAAELKLGNIFATSTARQLYNILYSLLDLTNWQNFISAVTTKIFNIALTNIVKKDDNPILEALRQRFFYYQQVWQDWGIFSLIYTILEDISLDKNSLTNRELANLWQLAELLNKYHQKINNQVELLFWFKERITQASENLMNNLETDNEELIRLENDDEQIIITTQHKAKGLEYEILFCPYFKNNIIMDGQFDFNYRRPFFSSYRKDNQPYSELVLDTELANYIVEKDNKEVHRLNYVALTRAKSRIYIYLKQNTITKATGKYNSREKPDKLAELFGYVKNNPNDTLHPLFNYPEFFSANPDQAIKDQAKLPGVRVYNRDNLSDEDLLKLRLTNDSKSATPVSLVKVRDNFRIDDAYTRQSYSGLTKIDDFDKNYDYYEKTEDELPVLINYRYTILNDKNLSGALFGTLFHELCEIYPFNQNQLDTVLLKYNVEDLDSRQELTQMVTEAFNYPLVDGKSLSSFSHVVYELEFNLTVDNTSKIQQLIGKHFGKNHPFSMASQLLGNVKAGFLVGFMDVCFEHAGKYWVLDYKTNTLIDYAGATGIEDTTNLIVLSMAEHHYYLQYLLYLVALKRYLQVRLKIADATHLIGGAVYYYVRGVYTTSSKVNDGLFIDDKCQQLVAALDKFLCVVS